MSYSIEFSGQFKKDTKLCKKRNYDISLLEEVLKKLREKGELPIIYKPHKLSGSYSNFWECHIKPDWLLIWKQNEDKKEIFLDRTGTHSDLF
jgi:mRNA interferase YafQ